MIIGVPKETFPGETRVALIPSTVPSLTKAGFEVLVESEAGLKAGYPNEEYLQKGAQILANRSDVFSKAEIVAAVRAGGANPGNTEDHPRLKTGQVLVGFLEPLTSREEMQQLAAAGVSAFSMELIPRITRAQVMDALSSQATVAGYKAVILAAEALPRMFPMLMTAAGTLSPARVFVMGAGVAGLQAIATARRLGALVQAYDVRPAVKEQVESLGARFLEIPLEASASEDKGGYARQLGEEFYRKQQEMTTQAIAESDVVITTALIPGKPAPTLVTRAMVEGMKPGSVIVDLAAERGGNCELTQPGETIHVGGVTIMGPSNAPSLAPYHASQMYSRNISAFILHLVKDQKVHIDLEDEIVRETLITQGGKIVHPRLQEQTQGGS